MNIYAIRIENDETVVVTAGSPEEALEQIGVPACLLLALQEPADTRAAGLRERYKVVELDHLHLHLRCLPGGNLDVHDADQRTYESLFELNPGVKLATMR
jgi:hypothetical protein